MNYNIPPARKVIKLERSGYPVRTVVYGFLILVNILILAGIGFLVYKTIKPIENSASQNNDSVILDKVAKLVTLDKTQVPTVATIADVDSLKKANAVQAQVYKDAQNGDYLVTTGNTMIIYRDSSNSIIYNGDSVNKILSDTQKKVTDRIIALAKSASYIPNDDTETPQLSAVTDAILSKSSTSDFYSGADKNDIIALFATNQVIIIYRASTDAIFRAGTYQTVITTIGQ